MNPTSPPAADRHVAILLSAYDGARFLPEQLDSLLAQSHHNWTLYWRDDGSHDDTISILEGFAARAGPGRSVRIDGPARRLRPTESFMTLLREALARIGEHDFVAFADQDDVWLPHKLARGAAALSDVAEHIPTLYSARQMLVDAALRHLGDSPRLQRPTGFPAALTQNVTTGCTIMLNRSAAALVAGSTPAAETLHDWWCYLVVTAAGGRLLHDDERVVKYRQHDTNLVGAPLSMLHRGSAALRRGPGTFMNVLRGHLVALTAQPELMSPQARAQVAAIRQALQGGTIQRLAALRTPGLHRQTRLETFGFWLWFLIG